MADKSEVVLRTAVLTLTIEAIAFFCGIVWSLFRSDFLDVFLFFMLTMTTISKANEMNLKLKLLRLENGDKPDLS